MGCFDELNISMDIISVFYLSLIVFNIVLLVLSAMTIEPFTTEISTIN